MSAQLQKPRSRVVEPPRFPKRAERIRQDILAVATAEFAARGFDGGRIDHIANLTRTSKRMIYYYFGSKDGLYVAVLAEVYGRLRDMGLVAGEDESPPLDALAKLVASTFDHLSAYPDFVRLIIGENIRHADGLRAVSGIEQLGDELLGPLARICQRGLSSGCFRPGVTAVDLQMSISALCLFQRANQHTFAMLHGADMSSEQAIRRRRESVVSMVLEFAAANPTDLRKCVHQPEVNGSRDAPRSRQRTGDVSAHHAAGDLNAKVGPRSTALAVQRGAARQSRSAAEA